MGKLLLRMEGPSGHRKLVVSAGMIGAEGSLLCQLLASEGLRVREHMCETAILETPRECRKVQVADLPWTRCKISVTRWRLCTRITIEG